MRHHSMVLRGLLAACLLGSLTGTALAAEEVVARVNGEAITQTQFEQLAQQRAGRGVEQLTDAQRRQLLEEIVTLTVLAQDAREQGLADKPEVAAQLENLRRAVLAQAAVGKVTGGDVSDEEIQAAYEEQFSDSQRQQYHARHILVKEKAEAEKLITQLQEGADFTELAKEHSIGPAGAKGGDLGWFSPGHMVPPFSAAVTALEPGEYTKEPVKTQYGWHVILLEDVREAPVPELGAVRDQLRTQVVRQKAEAHISQLREQAEVEYQVEWAKGGES